MFAASEMVMSGKTPGSAKPEIAASMFPWDLADEGLDQVLDNLREMAGANSVYLCNLSEEVRPFRGGEFTHNPVRKTYIAEDCRVYWPPDPKYYGRIKPLRTQRDFLAGTDWVGEFAKAARAQGMKAGVELFHGFIDRPRLEGPFRDSMQVDIFGHPVLTHNYNKPAACLNSPDFQEYAVGLFSDLAANYDLDYIQTCMIPYVLPGSFLEHNLPPDPIGWALAAPEKGGCFCAHCLEAAGRHDFDLAAARPELLILARQDQQAVLDSGITAKDYLGTHPVLKRWLDFRCESVNSLYGLIGSRIQTLQPGIDLRWNNYIRTHGYYSGIDLPTFMNHLGSIRANAFVEHEDDMALVDEKVQYLHNFNKIVAGRLHWVASIDIRGKNPQVLERSAEVSSYTGCNGYALSHYGEAALENLRAVKRGLRKSKWAEYFN
ncbi:MAG: hypothetical protein M1457_05135 [bacterium]|nr:hypothetical protein [bacterium]